MLLRNLHACQWQLCRRRYDGYEVPEKMPFQFSTKRLEASSLPPAAPQQMGISLPLEGLGAWIETVWFLLCKEPAWFWEESSGRPTTPKLQPWIACDMAKHLMGPFLTMNNFTGIQRTIQWLGNVRSQSRASSLPADCSPS